jgi:hypothetical protein
MDEDEFLTPEQIEEILNTKYVFEYFVYFDKDNGSILALSNERLNYENFIQVEFEEIERFFNNKENFLNFKVTFDRDGSIKFVNKNQGDLIFKSNIVETIRLTDADSILTVEWSKEGWKFIMSEKFLQHPRAKSLNAKLHFYVTTDNNINFLVRQLEIQLRNLIGNGQLTIPFEKEKEKDIENISMFTLPFFESYGMRIKHD